MGYLFGHKKERNTDKWYNMDEPWKSFAKLKKSDTQKSHTVWFHLREMSKASQVALVVKNLPANAEGARHVDLVPELRWSPGVGNGNPLKYFCLENSRERSLVGYSSWSRKLKSATVHGVTKCQTQLSAWTTTRVCVIHFNITYTNHQITLQMHFTDSALYNSFPSFQ